MNKKEIVYYLFIFKQFRAQIIYAIYYLVFYNYEGLYLGIYNSLLNTFLKNKNKVENKTKKKFDEKYFEKWMTIIQNDNTILNENLNNDDDEFSNKILKINFQKYNYYDPY